MDCDTTGVEPDFALVKFKKLAGGGYFKIINRARCSRQLSLALGYPTKQQIAEIMRTTLIGTGVLPAKFVVEGRAEGCRRSALRASGTVFEHLAS